jgi:hypothetical protein
MKTLEGLLDLYKNFAESGKCEFLEFVKNVNKIHNIFKIILSNITSADNIKS